MDCDYCQVVSISVCLTSGKGHWLQVLRCFSQTSPKNGLNQLTFNKGIKKVFKSLHPCAQIMKKSSWFAKYQKFYFCIK